MSLGELGFVRYKANLLDHWRTEILENGKLKGCRSSFKNYWEPLLKHDTVEYYYSLPTSSITDTKEKLKKTQRIEKTQFSFTIWTITRRNGRL